MTTAIAHDPGDYELPQATVEATTLALLVEHATNDWCQRHQRHGWRAGDLPSYLLLAWRALRDSHCESLAYALGGLEYEARDGEPGERICGECLAQVTALVAPRHDGQLVRTIEP